MKTQIALAYCTWLLVVLCGCKPSKTTATATPVDERAEVVNFLCNNADSISVFTLKASQCGDSIYVNYFDSLTDQELRPKIVNNYIKSRYYKKMFRDSLDCNGKGVRHQYIIGQENVYKLRLTKIKDYNSFLKVSKPRDVYFVICRPLTIDDSHYYLVSLEQKESSYLERMWIKVTKDGCIKEVGSELSIM